MPPLRGLRGGHGEFRTEQHGDGQEIHSEGKANEREVERDEPENAQEDQVPPLIRGAPGDQGDSQQRPKEQNQDLWRLVGIGFRHGWNLWGVFPGYR